MALPNFSLPVANTQINFGTGPETVLPMPSTLSAPINTTTTLPSTIPVPPTSLEDLLVYGIACQRRTGPNKKFTVYYPDGKIYKGPFTGVEVDSLVHKYDTLKQWQTDLVTGPINRLTFKGGKDKGGGIFLVFDNLGIEPFDQCKVEPEPYTEKSGKYRYRILVRTDLDKLNKALANDKLAIGFYYSGQVTTLITSLIKLYLLEVGDTCTANVLFQYSTGLIYLIDIDCSEGPELKLERAQPHIERSDFFFSKALPKGDLPFWLAATNYYIIKANLLSTIPQLLQTSMIRFGKIIYYLDQQISLRETNAVVAPIIEPAVQPSRMITTGLPMTPIPMLMAPTPVLTTSTPVLTTPIPLPTISTPSPLPTTPSPTLRVSEFNPYSHLPDMFDPFQNNKGVMKEAIRNSVVISGCPWDQVISDLQKSIRRGLVVQAERIATEVFRMLEVNATWSLSNFRNRLAVIAVEDISPRYLPFILKVIAWSFSNPLTYTIESYLDLIIIIRTMCLVPKGRILSHLNRCHSNEVSFRACQERGLNLLSSHVPTTNHPSCLPVGVSECHPELLLSLNNFANSLTNKSLDVFYWASVFQKEMITKKLEKIGRRKTIHLLWDVIKLHLEPKTFNLIYEAFKKISGEERAFLNMAIFQSIYYSGHCNIDLATLPDNQYLLKLFSCFTPLVIADWSIDKHTSYGSRTLKRKREFFVKVGAHVENLDPFFDTPLFATFKACYEICLPDE